MSRPVCLVTRPEPGASETAAAVEALGWEAVLAPALVLAARPFDPPPPGGVQAVLLGSRAAARALAGRLGGHRVLGVGEATAAEARAAGAAEALAAAGGDAASLVALAGERLDPRAGPVLLAAGRGYGGDLAAGLRARGFRVLRRVAYEAREATALPDPAREALVAGRVGAALVTSPRGARVLVWLLRASGLEGAASGARAVALSERVARALAGGRWAAVEVAARPDGAALLARLGEADRARGAGGGG